MEVQCERIYHLINPIFSPFVCDYRNDAKNKLYEYFSKKKLPKSYRDCLFEPNIMINCEY